MATYTQTRLGAGPDLLTASYVAIYTVGSGETRLINLSLVMVAGEGIYGKASTANEITITISGIVETA